jgi:hypothetical protein
MSMLPRFRRATFLACCLLSLGATLARAQEPFRVSGPYLGATIGRFCESWEGNSGSVGVWTGVIGYDFNRRWGIRAEVAPGFELCDGSGLACHRHRYGISPMLTVRSQSMPLYATLGVVRAGLGLQAPIGRRFAAWAEADVAYRFESAFAWPRIGMAVRF